jgi:hypothetical protein
MHKKRQLVRLKYFRMLRVNGNFVLLVEEKQFSRGKGGQRLKLIIYLHLCRDYEFVMPYSKTFLHRNVMTLLRG